MRILLLFCLSFFAMQSALADEANKIILTNNISPEEKALIQADFNYLKTKDYSSESLGKTLEISDGKGGTLLDWLKLRVHYIVGLDFNLRSALTVSKNTVSYPSPDVFPAKAVAPPPSERKKQPRFGVTNMVNVGGIYYTLGKRMNSLLTINLPGSIALNVTSPRVGLLQMGPGFFQSDMGRIKQDQEADILHRLNILFHEARHSDGNGETLAFPHTICPEDHDLAYLNACDNSSNGPYAVGATLLYEMIKACNSCSIADKEKLKLIYVDQLSRLLLKEETLESTVLGVPSVNHWNADPESLP